MRFTKELVGIIEGKSGKVLSQKDIDSGSTSFEYTNTITKSVTAVSISRVSTKEVYVTAHFKGDSYNFVEGRVTIPKLKWILKQI